ncbi:hypothetical protein GCM10009801_21800 [Streptomyces albiaxialis]|uniref:Transposase n=1 Tax=Streptomyces albiaxialis TaxID=329523 RepID=A0ABN2VSH3_9ACTN
MTGIAHCASPLERGRSTTELHPRVREVFPVSGAALAACLNFSRSQGVDGKSVERRGTKRVKTPFGPLAQREALNAS